MWTPIMARPPNLVVLIWFSILLCTLSLCTHALRWCIVICFLICGQLQVILEKESSLSIDLPVKIKFKWNVCQLSTSRFAYNLGTIVWIPSIVLTHAAIQSNVMCSPDGLQSELNINGCLLKQWKPTFVDKWGDEGLEYSSFSTGTSTAFKYLLRASFFFIIDLH